MIKQRRTDLPVLSTSEQFDQFDRDNPHVYDTIVRLARQLRMEGYEKVGISLIYSVARWQLRTRTTTEGTGFRLNDHYQSFYARKVMAENPDLDGIFDLRKAEADDWATEKYGLFGGVA